MRLGCGWSGAKDEDGVGGWREDRVGTGWGEGAEGRRGGGGTGVAYLCMHLTVELPEAIGERSRPGARHFERPE